MIKLVKENQVALIKLNRPEKRNALHPDLVEDLKSKLKNLENDDETRIVIITGEGASFCAGADLAYLNNIKNYSLVENERDSQSLADLFLQVYHFPKPVIAAVNGAAIAGGCGLASVCDFIIADEQKSKFGYSEVKIGFLPAIVSIFLIKRVGEGIAKQMVLSGDIINGKRAYEIGLVNYLSEEPVGRAFELAEQLKQNSSFSMNLTKKLIHSISGFNVDEAVDYCVRLNAISRSSEDFQTGLNNFLNKKIG